MKPRTADSSNTEVKRDNTKYLMHMSQYAFLTLALYDLYETGGKHGYATALFALNFERANVQLARMMGRHEVANAISRNYSFLTNIGGRVNNVIVKAASTVVGGVAKGVEALDETLKRKFG